MSKRKAIVGGIVVLLLATVAAWGFGLLGGTDPAIAKLQQIGDQMAQTNLSDAQRDQIRGEFRQQMQSLTDDQRHAFFEANRGQWEARGQQRMNEFFAMSKTDQQKRLDEIIDRMAQSSNQQSGRGRNAGNRNGGGNRAGMTEAQREERSKRRIDHTDAKTRAQFTEFRRMLNQRAQQRGVQLGDHWGRGFGPRGA